MPQIKYTTEEKSGSYLLKPGEYDVFLVDFKWGKSEGKKTSGSDTLDFKFETQDGTWIFDSIIFHESTVWKASAFLRSFGHVLNEGDAVDINNDLLNAIIGTVPGRIKIGNKPYGGKNPKYIGTQQNVLEAYIAPQDGHAKPAKQADLSINESDIPF